MLLIAGVLPLSGADIVGGSLEDPTGQTGQAYLLTAYIAKRTDEGGILILLTGDPSIAFLADVQVDSASVSSEPLGSVAVGTVALQPLPGPLPDPSNPVALAFPPAAPMFAAFASAAGVPNGASYSFSGRVNGIVPVGGRATAIGPGNPTMAASTYATAGPTPCSHAFTPPFTGSASGLPISDGWGTGTGSLVSGSGFGGEAEAHMDGDPGAWYSGEDGWTNNPVTYTVGGGTVVCAHGSADVFAAATQKAPGSTPVYPAVAHAGLYGLVLKYKPNPSTGLDDYDGAKMCVIQAVSDQTPGGAGGVSSGGSGACSIELDVDVDHKYWGAELFEADVMGSDGTKADAKALNVVFGNIEFT